MSQIEVTIRQCDQFITVYDAETPVVTIQRRRVYSADPFTWCLYGTNGQCVLGTNSVSRVAYALAYEIGKPVTVLFERSDGSWNKYSSGPTTASK